MPTIRVTLDLSADELADVIAALDDNVRVLTEYAQMRHATPAERKLYRRRTVSAKIALRHLRMAERDGVDGGPVGTARHIIR